VTDAVYPFFAQRTLPIAALVQAKLANEIKRLHNPTSDKTAQLFRDYANVDVTLSWNWPGYDPARARETLNTYMKLRGDVAHRARHVDNGPPKPHPVTKDELSRAIRFLRSLVDATERALGSTTSDRQQAAA
jgi:hypothetical protein